MRLEISRLEDTRILDGARVDIILELAEGLWLVYCSRLFRIPLCVKFHIALAIN